MKKEDVKIASVYAIKFGNNTCGIRITSQHPHGGWVGVNISTGKSMHITSANRLCGLYNPKADTDISSLATGITPQADTTSTYLGGLRGAVRVLQEAGQPLNCKDIVEHMLKKGYWKTSGQTPASTIYSAILREIKTKGDKSRFHKTERGKFTINI